MSSIINWGRASWSIGGGAFGAFWKFGVRFVFSGDDVYDLGMFDDLRRAFSTFATVLGIGSWMVAILECFSPYDTHSHSHFLFLFPFQGRWNSLAYRTVDRRAGGRADLAGHGVYDTRFFLEKTRRVRI